MSKINNDCQIIVIVLDNIMQYIMPVIYSAVVYRTLILPLLQPSPRNHSTLIKRILRVNGKNQGYFNEYDFLSWKGSSIKRWWTVINIISDLADNPLKIILEKEAKKELLN